MEENHAEKPTGERTVLCWTIVGFSIGTLLAAPFVLAIDPADRVIGGTLFGGPPGALLGFCYGLRKRRVG